MASAFKGFVNVVAFIRLQSGNQQCQFLPLHCPEGSKKGQEVIIKIRSFDLPMGSSNSKKHVFESRIWPLLHYYSYQS